MALDPVLNFTLVTVSTGCVASATSVVLASGDGAKLPDPVVSGGFNLAAELDPSIEIVRVTAQEI
jgi:hypothetical protein